ncbi:MAG: hypothetical protein AB1589_33675 [Cyanobacteriota bacterium]
MALAYDTVRFVVGDAIASLAANFSYCRVDNAHLPVGAKHLGDN